MAREVEGSEFSMQFFRCLVTGIRSFFGRRVETKMDAILVDRDTRRKLTEASAINHSDVSSSVAAVSSLVSHVLSMGSFPKIDSPIIERIVIDMVSAMAKNKIVHGNAFAFGTRPGSHRIKTMHLCVPMSLPIPLVKPIIIAGINDGILSMRKRNKFDRLIAWLRNGVPGFRLSGHEVLLHRTLFNAAILS